MIEKNPFEYIGSSSNKWFGTIMLWLRHGNIYLKCIWNTITDQPGLKNPISCFSNFGQYCIYDWQTFDIYTKDIYEKLNQISLCIMQSFSCKKNKFYIIFL